MPFYKFFFWVLIGPYSAPTSCHRGLDDPGDATRGLQQFQEGGDPRSSAALGTGCPSNWIQGVPIGHHWTQGKKHETPDDIMERRKHRDFSRVKTGGTCSGEGAGDM